MVRKIDIYQVCVCVCVCVCARTHVRMPVCRGICVSVCLGICVSVCLCICVSVCRGAMSTNATKNENSTNKIKMQACYDYKCDKDENSTNQK